MQTSLICAELPDGQQALTTGREEASGRKGSHWPSPGLAQSHASSPGWPEGSRCKLYSVSCGCSTNGLEQQKPMLTVPEARGPTSA